LLVGALPLEFDKLAFDYQSVYAGGAARRNIACGQGDQLSRMLTTTRCRTCPAGAPKATRIPISRVPRVTSWANRPYKPRMPAATPPIQTNGQRLEHHGVDGAKYGGAGADTQRQGGAPLRFIPAVTRIPGLNVTAIFSWRSRTQENTPRRAAGGSLNSRRQTCRRGGASNLSSLPRACESPRFGLHPLLALNDHSPFLQSEDLGNVMATVTLAQEGRSDTIL
jgi:hypothetical protein